MNVAISLVLTTFAKKLYQVLPEHGGTAKTGRILISKKKDSLTEVLFCY